MPVWERQEVQEVLFSKGVHLMPETRSLKDICDVINSAEDDVSLQCQLESVDCSDLSAHDVRALIIEAYDAGWDVGLEAGKEWVANHGL